MQQNVKVFIEETRVRKMFGWNLKRQLAMRGLTQQQFADLLGTTQGQVGAWATGKTIPSFKGLLRICSVLGISTDHLWRDPDAR